MAPDSLALEIVAGVLTLLTAAGLGVLWSYSNGRLRWLNRSMAVVACVAATAATGLVWVNRQIDEYPTWASLLGSTADAAGAPIAQTDDGQVVSFTVAGPVSHLSMPVYAYLPPRYRNDTGTRYPVIEALHGYPGSPLQWIKKLGVTQVLNTEIGAGRMAPTIVLFPYQTPNPRLDTECTNLVGGPQTETFLTVDVPRYARAHLRLNGSWGLTGYSAGAYCASDLLLRHPTEYAAAASLSGYADPGIRVGNGTEHTSYNEMWRLTHLPIPAVALYLTCARTDKNALRGTQALARTARAPMSVTTAYVNGGGHNQSTWRAMEAPSFDWLSSWLARPQDDGSSR
ncbi:alpha/beta hydrolase [Actinoplanes sp. NPDC051343]|jgi:enterochelin esterase-like enzyme|uniref:alpha/beta hydrolase n=1 Tax=Actinoplanes sp. NPDC051343 TaxID=3363906 RepID=UPI0037A8EF9E